MCLFTGLHTFENALNNEDTQRSQSIDGLFTRAQHGLTKSVVDFNFFKVKVEGRVQMPEVYLSTRIQSNSLQNTSWPDEITR